MSIICEGFQNLSDDYAIKMVAFVLYYLCGKAGVVCLMLFHVLACVADGDVLVADCLSGACEGKAAFLGLISAVAAGDDGVEHNDISQTRVENYYSLMHAYHISRHTDTAVLVGFEGILEVLYRLRVGL